MLALVATMLSASSADAFGRRRCNGCWGGGGCAGGRFLSRGCHGGYGCNGGAVYRSGCHGCNGGVSYSSGRFYYGGSPYGVARESYYPPEGQGVAKNTAVLTFRAPEGAKIWVDGRLSARSGDPWRWTSPALRERRSYQVQARWSDQGRVVTQTRTIQVEPGGNLTVDFTRREAPSDQAAPQPRRPDAAPAVPPASRPPIPPDAPPKLRPDQ
jgi:uncharacterized protein (TIGR03000 family)